MSPCWVFVVAWEIFITARGFSPVLAGGLSYLVACGIPLPQPGIELTSPALGGRFSTTGPSREVPDLILLNELNLLCPE